MRLSKNDFVTPMPYPLQADAGPGQEDLVEIRGSYGGEAPATVSPSVRDTADLLDLVADHRRDLLATLVEALSDSESTRDNAQRLVELVADCGLADVPSPFATAMAVSADLERLANTSSQWTHPAQVVKNPAAQALYKLCAARIEHQTGASRERLERIQPLLERTARLTEKAATRRTQSAARQPNLIDRWL